MASPPFTLDTSLPADVDFASQFPNNERQNRDRIQSWLLTNHNNNGNHTNVKMDDMTSDPSDPGAGHIMFYNKGGVLYTMIGGVGTPAKVDAFPTGTILNFFNPNPPAGWTINTFHTDRTIIFGTAGQGGSQGGTGWGITGLTVQGHALTIGEMPSHSHTGKPNNDGNGAFSVGSGVVRWDGNFLQTDANGSNQAHSHGITQDGTWRPAFTYTVMGIKA